LIITYGSAGEDLAKSISKITGQTLAKTSCRRFPDGEQYVKITGELSGEDVAIVQSFGLNPDQLFMEYALIADAARGSGCGSVTAIVPYLAYTRQDRRFQSGEALSAKLFPRLIEDAGTDRVITVDMHLHRFKEIGQVFRIPAVNLSAMPLLAEYYGKRRSSRNALVIGPDKESEQWAESVAEKLSTDYTILEKERLGDRDVEVSGDLCVKGRSVVLVDDIISTGKTLMEVISRLKAEGASRIDALVTHALLVENALPKLKRAGLSELIATDTVANPAAKVSVSPLITEALKK
jgi:ribose-phosphate pyrophosphokinase